MAAETRKSRKSNFSQEEIDVLITTVMQNHNILYGETSKSFFHKEIRNQVWNIILEEVNKVSLERRTLNEVKNKWKKCQYSLRAADHVETVDYVDGEDLDSMPLQQRLSQNHNEQPPSTPNQEAVLQSQPISPTKLKVTRQGAKPHPPPAKPPTPPPPNPEVCLRWNSHHTNMQTTFPSLLTKEQYVDATLVSEGKTLKCHRMILSSCSPYFEQVLEGIGPFQHPVLFMKDVPFWILKALCDFMYAGEVHIYQEKLQELLNVAEALKIKGLAGNADTREDIKPVIPEIKQEIDAAPPLRSPEKALKEEKEEESSLFPKLARHEAVRLSKKKEDKKSKHAAQMPKEKEKERMLEDSPPKVLPKANPKLVLPKMTPKVVLSKVVIPKVQSTSKAAVKNVMKNVLQRVPKPSTSKAAHASRKSDTSRKSDKHKAEVVNQKEKEKEKDKPPLKKDNINDPLDLLEPVYEEIAKEDPLPMLKCINPAKLKERGNVPVRKGVNKKVKKRRYAEYAEEREESPPPVFPPRKGTRSRPHVKIPKFFHTHYEETQKETTDATIVREPHTDQSDPLIGLEDVEEIKAEPLDVEENTIEMEENLENYMQDQEMTFQEGEEIIGNYDSPIVNIKREVIKRNTPNIFKKMLDPQPVIMNIHTVTEENPQEVRLLNLHENTLKIVDISRISTGQNRIEETIIGTGGFDDLVNTQEKTSDIVISDVQSMAEISEDNRSKESELNKEDGAMPADSEEQRNEHRPIVPSIRISEEPYDTSPNPPESEGRLIEANQIPLQIKLENVQSENSQDNQEFGHAQLETDTDRALAESSCLALPDRDGAVASASLGSLEDRFDTCTIESRPLELEKEVQGSEQDVCENQNEIGRNVEEVPISCTDKDSLGHTVEPVQLIVPESQNAMSVDSEIEGSQELGTYEANYSVDQPQNCNPKKIQRTAEDSDVGTERHTFAGLDDTLPGEIEEMHRNEGQGVQSAPEGEGSYSAEETQQFTSDNKGINIDRSCIEPAQEACDSEEMMSIGPVSQEAMSIDIGSQGSELLASGDAPFQRTVEEAQCYNAVDTLSQDPLQNLGEAETVRNDGETNVTLQDSRELDEENLQKTDPEIAQINTGVIVEEGVANSEATEFRESIQNTPEMISVEDHGQNAEHDILCETAVPLQENAVGNGGTESVDIIYEKSKNNEGLEKRRFDSAQPESTDTDTVVPVSNRDILMETEETDAEGELEECLASTSNVVVPVSRGENSKRDADALPFNEDEDFTKDIEFDNFIGRNRPTNYLDDEFNDDFVMEDVERRKNTRRTAEREDRLTESEDRNIGGGDTEDISDTKGERTGGKAENIIGDSVSDMGAVNEDRLAEGDNKDAERKDMGDNIVRSEDAQENISQNRQKRHLTHEKMDRLDDTNAGHTVNLNEHVIPTNDGPLDIVRSISETVDNYQEHPDCREDEDKLEERLLADDDVEMSEASTSREADDGSEKTLEMIVNDLNESLGELRK